MISRRFTVIAALVLFSVSIASFGAVPHVSANNVLSVNVDAAVGVQPISPDIYGLNNAPASVIHDLNATVDRKGGNRQSTYNWNLGDNSRNNPDDASNGVRDYYFENSGGGCTTPGCSADAQVTNDKNGGAASYLVVPTIGYVSKDTSSCSFSVAKYGAQTGTSPDNPDCGNGFLQPNGTQITGNDPTDAYVALGANGPNYMKGWIRHLVGTFGTAARGGVKYFGMDNEPDIWYYDHFDVAPTPLTYETELAEFQPYASMVKSVDPSALVAGPTDTLYPYFLDDAADNANGNTNDLQAHGNVPFDAWFLQRVHQHDVQAGGRTLDVFDLHWYPQGDNVYTGGQDGNDPTTDACRLQETRALWDPTFVDNVCNSWYGSYPAPQLIPRMHGWVNQYYPGTKTGLGEWNFGDDNHLNGALAIADVLGIFGRQGLDYASYWEYPSPGSPGAFAFKMYRNYDGADSTFGDTSIAATSSNTDQLMSFGSLRSSTGQLLVMLVNQDPSNAADTSISIHNYMPTGTVSVYQYSGANLNAIQQSSVNAANGLEMVVPAASITLLVMNPAANAVTTSYPSPAATGIGTTTATLNGTVIPNGALSACHFDYGTTTAYGSSVPCASLQGGNTPQSVQASISGLTPDMTYHFRLVVDNGSGPVDGADEQFLTAFALATGWNLVSVPTDVPYDAARITTEIGSSATAVATYGNGAFAVYVRAFSPNIALQPYQGVFLLMSAAGAWHPSGNPLAVAPISIPLAVGWSLLAEPLPSVHTPQDIANQIGPAGCANPGSGTPCAITELVGFSGSRYSVYMPPGTSSLPLRSGDGFFVLAPSGADWAPNGGA